MRVAGYGTGSQRLRTSDTFTWASTVVAGHVDAEPGRVGEVVEVAAFADVADVGAPDLAGEVVEGGEPQVDRVLRGGRVGEREHRIAATQVVAEGDERVHAGADAAGRSVPGSSRMSGRANGTTSDPRSTAEPTIRVTRRLSGRRPMRRMPR